MDVRREGRRPPGSRACRRRYLTAFDRSYRGPSLSLGLEGVTRTSCIYFSIPGDPSADQAFSIYSQGPVQSEHTCSEMRYCNHRDQRPWRSVAARQDNKYTRLGSSRPPRKANVAPGKCRSTVQFCHLWPRNSSSLHTKPQKLAACTSLPLTEEEPEKSANLCFQCNHSPRLAQHLHCLCTKFCRSGTPNS